MPHRPGRWTPPDATRRINACARGNDLTASYAAHAKARLIERGLLIGDVIYVLKNGYVYEDAEVSTRSGFFKYCIEGRSPNSDGRTLRLVVVPSGGAEIKIVTVMWKDEK